MGEHPPLGTEFIDDFGRFMVRVYFEEAEQEQDKERRQADWLASVKADRAEQVRRHMGLMGH